MAGDDAPKAMLAKLESAANGSKAKDSAPSYLRWAIRRSIFLGRNSASDRSLKAQRLQGGLLPRTGAAGTGVGNRSGRVEPSENSSAFVRYGWVQARLAAPKASLGGPIK